MGQAVVTIDGRIYRMGCEDGQEQHLQDLATNLNTKMQSLRTDFGEIGEQRLTMMTALTIADELFEAKQRAALLEAELSTYRNALSEAQVQDAALRMRAAAALTESAERIERVATLLKSRKKLSFRK